MYIQLPWLRSWLASLGHRCRLTWEATMWRTRKSCDLARLPAKFNGMTTNGWMPNWLIPPGHILQEFNKFTNPHSTFSNDLELQWVWDQYMQFGLLLEIVELRQYESRIQMNTMRTGMGQRALARSRSHFDTWEIVLTGLASTWFNSFVGSKCWFQQTILQWFVPIKVAFVCCFTVRISYVTVSNVGTGCHRLAPVLLGLGLTPRRPALLPSIPPSQATCKWVFAIFFFPDSWQLNGVPTWQPNLSWCFKIFTPCVSSWQTWKPDSIC